MNIFNSLNNRTKGILKSMFTSMIYSAAILIIYVLLTKVFPSNLSQGGFGVKSLISAIIILGVFIMFIRDVFINVPKRSKLIALTLVLIMSLIISWIISGYFINIGLYLSTSLVMILTLSVFKLIVDRLRRRIAKR